MWSEEHNKGEMAKGIGTGFFSTGLNLLGTKRVAGGDFGTLMKET